MEKTYYFPIFYLHIQEDNYLTSNAEFAKLEELLQPDWLPQSKWHQPVENEAKFDGTEANRTIGGGAFLNWIFFNTFKKFVTSVSEACLFAYQLFSKYALERLFSFSSGIYCHYTRQCNSFYMPSCRNKYQTVCVMFPRTLIFQFSEYRSPK